MTLVITTIVHDFASVSFVKLGIDIEFSGKGENEEGVIIGLDVEVFSRVGLDAGKLFWVAQ